MGSDNGLWQRAADLQREGEAFVMITVVGAQGSTPRNPGARMLWRPGAGLDGTVGGGQFEHLAIDSAQKHFRERSCAVERFVLGADADQCCGGTIDLFFEYCGPLQRLVVFGAGHVAHALRACLDAAALQVVIVDDRPEWNSAERFPGCRRVLDFDEGVAAAHQKPAATLACVMTCSHDTDFDLLRKLLLGEPPAFTGLIGSRSKRACLFRRLVASGVEAGRVERVHCPIGLGDMGKAPRLVAVSIAGQILLESKKLAAL